MQKYRLQQTIEAARWTDTPENREAFAAWFDRYPALDAFELTADRKDPTP